MFCQSVLEEDFKNFQNADEMNLPLLGLSASPQVKIVESFMSPNYPN